MSLRLQLLLVSLLTLVLPWAAWRYAQEMETTLRKGQEDSLLRTADVLGRVVASQPEEIYRYALLRERFDPLQGDVFAPLLLTQPLLDGFADEWPVPQRPIPGLEDDATRLRLGMFGRFLHIYLEVIDQQIRYQQPSSGEDEPPTSNSPDRLVFLTRDDSSSDELARKRAWSVSAVAPGPLQVHLADTGTPFSALPDELPSVTGIWRETERGYAVELRAPLSLFATQLSILKVNADVTDIKTIRDLGWLHVASESLTQRLQQYAPKNVRVSVVDARGWLVARAGSVASGLPVTRETGLTEDENGFLRSTYRGVFERPRPATPAYGLPYAMWGPPIDQARGGKPDAIWSPASGGEQSLVRAAVPIRQGDTLLGALIIEQPAEELVLTRELALTRLLNSTLLVSLCAIVVTLLFAARLSQRIRRLSRAASTALTPEGRIEADIPGTAAHDELGEVARNYSMLLGRVKEYTSYLQTLGNKLSHELRTPLTIVSSSLENLSSEMALTGNSQTYVERARDGTHRMQSILTAMTEATRVEQSIEHTERVDFDLTELVRNMGLAYRQTFSSHQIDTQLPAGPCTVNGSPELIVQLLDKLLDNATDFTAPGGAISLALEVNPRTARLNVSNQGQLLPPHLDGRLFESLVSGRSGAEQKPHLGLGLYIVRLIAEFHRGQAAATNLQDGSGVIVSIEMPHVGANIPWTG
jgi:two-component system, OmpR family, sensor histidine kinase ChvG